MRWSWVFVLVALASHSAARTEDCSVPEFKAEAISDLLDKYYGEGLRMIGRALNVDSTYEDDPELMEVTFNTMETWEEICEGILRVNDDCEITTVEGLSLKYERERRSAFKCTK